MPSPIFRTNRIHQSCPSKDEPHFDSSTDSLHVSNMAAVKSQRGSTETLEERAVPELLDQNNPLPPNTPPPTKHGLPLEDV